MTRRLLNDKEVKELANLLAEKVGQHKILEREIEFLKGEFTDQVEFTESKKHFGKTTLCNYRVQENLAVHPPRKFEVDKKKILYVYLQKNFPDWYRKNLEIPRDILCKKAEAVMKEEHVSKRDWVPWPHCKREPYIALTFRLNPGAFKKNYDKRLDKYGFKGK